MPLEEPVPKHDKPSAWRISTQWQHGSGKRNHMGTYAIFLMRVALLTIVLKVFMASFLSDLPSGKIHFSQTSVFSSFPTMQWISPNLQEGVPVCPWVCPAYRAPSFKVCISQCAGAHLICQLKVWPHLFSQADDQITQGYRDSSTFTSDRFKWEKRYWLKVWALDCP